MNILSLAGEWHIAGTDTPFVLPGSACDNAYGTPQEELAEMTKENVRCLRPRYDYVGALELEREVCVPEEFEGKHLTMFLERVNIASELWVDDEKIDRQIIELTTPHRYDLTGRLTAGTHKMRLRIDNSNLLNIDGMASGYSVDTQSIWLGVIGRIELQCREKHHIKDVQVYPSEKDIRVKIVLHGCCSGPDDRERVRLSLGVTAPDGAELAPLEAETVLFNSTQTVHLTYPMGDTIQYWNEFHPDLYTLNVTADFGDTKGESSVRFGMRTIKTENKKILLNGRQISLRGTTDCAINPLTGYPPTDKEYWADYMRTIKQYGFNHLRFHAWTPPETAFEAADEAGVYVSAEMPLWLNNDVCALETGDDPIHRTYYTNEAISISKYYGNHPSFIMFSNGNELLGDFELLEDITSLIRSYDNRRIYTMTTNFDHAVSPVEDYLCAFEAGGHRVRIQTMHDLVSEDTRTCYDEAVRDVRVPVISFEVGQYCVYPDVDSIKDYTGNLRPVNFEVILKDMKAKGVYPRLDRYIKASGALAALLYKEDMEASERTKNMGGFELLGISDYTGQCTATIGLLDVFRKSKGIVSPEKFREACDEVVPLMKAQRVFSSSDIFDAELYLYDFSETKGGFCEFTLRFYDGDKLIREEKTSKNRISFPLDFITRPTMVRAELSAKGHKNTWNIFVYPEAETNAKVNVISSYEEIKAAIENGGKYIIAAAKENLVRPIGGEFTPVFWSPAYFPSDRACGLWIDKGHKVFSSFPTGEYADFQWKHPIDNSVSADMSDISRDFDVIIEPVPNFFTNIPRSPLFEARVGKADILFCGFDLSVDDKAVKALRRSIYEYAASEEFVPVQEIDKDSFIKLFKK